VAERGGDAMLPRIGIMRYRNDEPPALKPRKKAVKKYRLIR
jgi:hypothetical protein